jgi:hypothetical protein
VSRRDKTIDLRGIDPESSEYWEEMLKRSHLQMARGRSDRLSYVGTASDVEQIHGIHTQDTGKVVPKGEGPA